MYSEQFFVGDSNKVAVETCIEALRSEGGKIVVLEAPSGCGKTHLLSQIKQCLKQKKVLYYTMETFVDALTKNQQPILRQTDLLLLDDTHYLYGKEFTQEKIAKIINKTSGDVKVFLVTDDVKSLEPLVKVISIPLVFVRVTFPDFNLKMQVLNNLLVERNICITSDEKKKLCTGALTINQLYGFVQKLHLKTKMKKNMSEYNV